MNTATLAKTADNLPATNLKGLSEFAIEHLKRNEAKIDAAIERFSAVTVVDHLDAVGLGFANEGRKTLKAARCEVENDRKALNKDVTAFTKAVNSEAKRLKEKIAAEEDRVAELIKKAEQLKAEAEEAERQQQIAERKAFIQARVDRLTEIGAPVDLQTIANLSDDDFNLNVAFAGEQARRQRDEERRQELQRQAEDKRLAEERERLQREREELDLLRAEQAAHERPTDPVEAEQHDRNTLRDHAPPEAIDAPEAELQTFADYDAQFASDVEELGGRLRQFVASTLDDMCRPSWMPAAVNAIEELEAAIKLQHVTS